MRLLLAEDEKALSEILVTVLEKNHYSVETVSDGLSALKSLETGIYDGAILDVMMPGTDGITVLKTLRKNGNMLPVMLLTAKSEVEDRVAGLDSGANDYLPKPFDTRELLARVRAMMRLQNVQTDEVSRIGNIRLDHATMEMSSEGSSFRLSGKEFQMMKIFMANPGVPISTDILLDKVWGEGGGEGNRTVWVYVSFLRKKLKALHADIGITTAGKESYQLEVYRYVQWPLTSGLR